MGNLEQKIRLHKIGKEKYHPERQQLDLRSVGTEDSTLILTRNDWSQLRTLVISNNNIEDENIVRILQSSFPSITELNLYTNCITDAGLQAILQALGTQLIILLLCTHRPLF